MLHQRVNADDNVRLVLHDPSHHLAENQQFESIRIGEHNSPARIQ
jgi:hypothetical protein